MPRCEKCHSQWASVFRCPHCERKFPCPNFVFLWSLAALAGCLLLFAVYRLTNETMDGWQTYREDQPVAEEGLKVEIDRSSIP